MLGALAIVEMKHYYAVLRRSCLQKTKELEDYLFEHKKYIILSTLGQEILYAFKAPTKISVHRLRKLNMNTNDFNETKNM